MNFFKTDFISCKPISNLDDLFKWPFESNNKNGCRQFKTEKLLLPNEELSQNANRTKIIVCHDMKNNYLEDKFFQGFDQGAANYSFYHWNLIDIFIYFSHHFITIPPESWINAAHENNCRILGTFITVKNIFIQLIFRF
jgi:mannosyl-glycoprotein endo-beta-N-acetylglucosaminidase